MGKKIFESSDEAYKSDPEKNAILVEEFKRVNETCRQQFQESKTFKEIDRDETLRLLNELEKGRYELHKYLFFKIKARKLVGNQIKALIKDKTVKAMDRFHNGNGGFEEDDIAFNVKRLGLEREAEVVFS